MKNKENYGVSVIIPTYNRGDVIGNTIKSVLEQTYDNIEIIIVDDASSDNTSDVIAGYEDKRIKYYRSEKNLGPSGARNVGIKYAQFQFVAFIDSDVIWDKEKLQKQLEMITDKEYALCYCGVKRKTKNNEIISTIPNENEKGSDLSGNIYRLLLGHNVVDTSTAIIRKRILNEFNGFEQSIYALEDYELFLRISRKYEFVYLDEVLVESIDYGDGVNDEEKNTVNHLKAKLFIWDEFSEDIVKCRAKTLYQWLATTVSFLNKDDFLQYKDELEDRLGKYEVYTLRARRKYIYKDNIMRRLMEEDDKKLKNFVQNNIEKTITIYGCGYIGQVLYYKLRGFGKKVSFFISKDKVCNIEECNIYTTSEEIPRFDVAVISIFDGNKNAYHYLEQFPGVEIVDISEIC